MADKTSIYSKWLAPEKETIAAFHTRARKFAASSTDERGTLGDILADDDLKGYKRLALVRDFLIGKYWLLADERDGIFKRYDGLINSTWDLATPALLAQNKKIAAGQDSSAEQAIIDRALAKEEGLQADKARELQAVYAKMAAVEELKTEFGV